MHKIVFFFQKIKNMWAYPTKDFQTRNPKHTYFFIWPKQMRVVNVGKEINIVMFSESH